MTKTSAASAASADKDRPTKRVKFPPQTKLKKDCKTEATARLPMTKTQSVGETSSEEPIQPKAPPEKQPVKEESKTGPATVVEKGFVVKCENDECVTVSAEEATTLKAKSEFFRNSFRHGTQESQSGILSKPDWTKETADHIVSLLVEGKCEIPFHYQSLRQAAQQILLPIQVRHPLNGSDISHDTEMVQSLSNRWTKRKSHFFLETPLLNDVSKWSAFFKSGVVILRDEKQLVLETKAENADNSINEAVYESNTFLVGASTPLCVSVYHTCLCLSGFNDSKKQASKTSSLVLGFQANFGTGDYLQRKLGKRFAIQKMDACEVIHYNDGVIEELYKLLGEVEDFIIPPKVCMLCAPNPNSWALGIFIRAAQNCNDNPGTLGWGVNSNIFYAVKTTRDIRTMLSLMADPSTQAAAGGQLRIKQNAIQAGWPAF